MKELTKTLATIQTELKAKKSSYNSFGKYYFRKSEDILEAIKPFLLKYNVYVTVNEEIVGIDHVPIIQSTATISDGKDCVCATAIVGVDLNQKGMQTAQQFGAASTYGKKYALGNLFLIDDTEDADAGNKHGVVDKIKAKAKPVGYGYINTDQYDKAKEYVLAGGEVSAITAKYKLKPNQLKELNELKKEKASITKA